MQGASRKMKIGIVGAGWYGCHLACVLKSAGYEVTLFEKNADFFMGISGEFGIRLHAGPHYPRSAETRKNCRRGFDEFYKRYPELVIEHAYSIYGLGEVGANNEPTKVNAEQFKAICKESINCHEIDPKTWGYQNLISAINIEEPSIAVGERLHKTFRKYLKEAGVNPVFNFEVKKLEKSGDKISISNGQVTEYFDHIINATSFQSLLPTEELPFEMELVYQPCLALVYEDSMPTERPLSFIVMDGWFPCLMPNNGLQEEKQATRKYLLTHGKWTIMGSFAKASEAQNLLENLDKDFIEQQVKPPSEQEMNRFWPEFAQRFKYTGQWKGAVLAKLKTTREFRSAITFAKDGVIHIIPGKVSNIFDAEREVFAYLNKENVLCFNGYHYIRKGVLDDSLGELREKPKMGEPNTCTLQTFEELMQQVKHNKKRIKSRSNEYRHV